MAGIVWWEIETPSPEQFMDFHAQLSGWTFQPAFQNTALNADYWLIQNGAETIGGLQRSVPNAAAPSAGTRIYLAVDDLEATLANAERLGGRTERARTELGGDDRWFATFVDPTGISIGLWTASGR